MQSTPAEHQPDADAATSPEARTKNVLLAVALNCLVPGLGLAYLGRWWMAFVNFLIVQAIVIGPIVAKESTIIEHIHWVLMVAIVGSGALAHGVATAAVAAGSR
jgi:hypothetical protein